jgi:hypothetical protein
MKDNNMQETIFYARKCLISFYYYYPHTTYTHLTRSKNLKQTLIQEIDMAMMDNQVRITL